jgi:hypothetical protein
VHSPADTSGYGSPGTTATGGGMGTGSGASPNSATSPGNNSTSPNQMAPNSTMQNGQ